MTVAPIGIANRASGDGDDADELDSWCGELGIELRRPDGELADSVSDAASEAPPYIAVVGGDGTMRTAAGVLAGGDVPLLPVPGGTFNHFAKAVGIASLDDAGAAARGGDVRALGVATVNDEVFLNTCAIGWYPEMVRTREGLRERWPRPIAAVAAFVRHAPHLDSFTVEIGNDAHQAWLLWVGNGRFGTGPAELAERDELGEVIDVRVASTAPHLPRTRTVLDLVFGRLRRSEHLERMVVDHPVTAALDRAVVTAALDAEVLELRPPLEFRPAARRLRVLVHPGAPS